MIKILNKKDTIANHFMYEMRHKDIQNDRGKFRNNLKRLGEFMALELSGDLEYISQPVETTLGKTSIRMLANQPVIVGILRAAIPFYDGFLEIFDQADGGFVGAYREEGDEIDVQLDYLAVPSLAGRDLILTDPMLATGKSMIKTIDKLKRFGIPRHIHIAAAIAAPEGIDYISKSLKIDNTIWCFAVDEKLNDQSYIVPGLGDAGDLSYGEKI